MNCASSVSISHLVAIVCKTLLMTFELLRTAAIYFVMGLSFVHLDLLMFVCQTKMEVYSGKWCLATKQVYFRLGLFLALLSIAVENRDVETGVW